MPPIQVLPVEEVDVITGENDHPGLLNIESRKLGYRSLEENRLRRICELSYHSLGDDLSFHHFPQLNYY